MWLFIISDALTFSALLFAYTYSRVANPDWPTPFHFSPSIIFSTVMTFCLLSSSLTMVMAVHAMNHGNRKAAVALDSGHHGRRRRLRGAAPYGVAEPDQHEHVTPFSNPGACRCSAARSSRSPACT